MAIKIEANKVYKCQTPAIGSGVIHVIGGTIQLFGSNVTENDENGKLIVPKFAELVSTEDELSEGIHPLTGLCEWFGFTGDATAVWVKMGVDSRIVPGEE